MPPIGPGQRIIPEKKDNKANAPGGNSNSGNSNTNKSKGGQISKESTSYKNKAR